MCVTSLINSLGTSVVQIKSLNSSVNRTACCLLSIGEAGFFNYTVLVNNSVLFFKSSKHVCCKYLQATAQNCSFVYFLAPSPPTIKTKMIRSCENAALVCWDSRDINPVDSYVVELSKLSEEENGDNITE